MRKKREIEKRKKKTDLEQRVRRKYFDSDDVAICMGMS